MTEGSAAGTRHRAGRARRTAALAVVALASAASPAVAQNLRDATFEFLNDRCVAAYVADQPGRTDGLAMLDDAGAQEWLDGAGGSAWTVAGSAEQNPLLDLDATGNVPGCYVFAYDMDNAAYTQVVEAWAAVAGAHFAEEATAANVASDGVQRVFRGTSTSGAEVSVLAIFVTVPMESAVFIVTSAAVHEEVL